MNPPKVVKLKICLAGDPAVGKTSLIRRFALNQYGDAYIQTMGAKVCKKTLDLYSRRQRAAVRADLMIWDTMGQRSYQELLRDAYFRDADGVLMVCDLTRRETLLNLGPWMEAVRSAAGLIPFCLLLNKADLRGEAQISHEDLEAFHRSSGYPYFLTSAKTGERVQEAFEALVGRILEDMELEAPPRP